MRVLLMLLVATTAYADPPKYTRKQTVHVDVKQSERTKPLVPKTQTPVQKPVGAEQVLLIQERQAPLREEQEQILVGLIRDAPDDDPDKPDYMFRLAESYAQQEKLWRLK